MQMRVLTKVVYSSGKWERLLYDTSEGVEYLVMNLVDRFVRTPEEKRTFVWSRSGRVTDQDKVLRRQPLTSPRCILRIYRDAS